MIEIQFPSSSRRTLRTVKGRVVSLSIIRQITSPRFTRDKERIKQINRPSYSYDTIVLINLFQLSNESHLFFLFQRGNGEKEREMESPVNSRLVIMDDFLAMSISSASSSSLSLSTPTSPKITVTESEGDSIARLTRINTNSREKLVYVPYGENDEYLLNENKKAFDDVNFCFHCEKEGLSQQPTRRKNTLTEPPTNTTWTVTPQSSSKPRRPRSTSSIGTVGRDILQSSIEKTGSRMVKGLFVTIYRQVFLCSSCKETIEKAKEQDSNFVVKISPRAREYFQ